MAAPRFTLAEREKVVEEAINLITEPASWVTGQWKCEVYETDEKGNLIYEEDENGLKRPIRSRDLYNRELSQYCIEGAVHQAMHNVLGERRAESMGAYFDDSGDDTRWPTDILGIDELARKQYPDICEGESHAALVLNDYHQNSEQEKGHKRILGLLRDSLAEIKAKRGR